MMRVDFVTGEQKAFTFLDQLILIAKREKEGKDNEEKKSKA